MDLAQFLVSLTVLLVIMFGVMLPGVAYLILLERKIAAWSQDRIGPNRVGFGGLIRPVSNLVLAAPLAPFWLLGYFRDVDPDRLWQSSGGEKLTRFHFWGLGQPIADGVKFVAKEDYNPRDVDRGLFIAAPVIAVIPALLAWAVIPWGGVWDSPWGGLSITVADLNIGVIYILAFSSLGVYGIAVGAWAANNKYTFVGGIRATAQMLSYEIPLGLCVLCILLLAGTASASGLVAAQVGYWHTVVPSWYILQQPLAAILFFICILAESNRAPFDLAEAEQELIGGFHTEYSSMKFALFFLGEYTHMIIGCAFFAILFLGGWHLPWVDYVIYGGAQPVYADILGVLLKVFVFFGKILLLLAIMMWIRWTLPRFRFDQLMRTAWGGLIPITLVLLLVTGWFVYMDWASYMWLGNLLVVAMFVLARPFVPKPPPVNRKVPLAGSRFSPAETGR